MSSSLQLNGRRTAKGAVLEFYLVHPLKDCEYCQVDAEDPVICFTCGKGHPQLYRMWRKPKGMFGCWVVFRYLGKDRCPDLSCPMALEEVPYGSEKLTLEENAKAWHKS